MLMPDFINREYTAEVLRTRSAASPAPDVIRRLVTQEWAEERLAQDGATVTVLHSFVSSEFAYHRNRQTKFRADGNELPRRHMVLTREHFLYDVLVLHKGRHTIVAVPFHGLAQRFFLDVDAALAGSRTVYETLDITNMIVGLGLEGKTHVSGSDHGATEIGLTRCHLAYDDPLEHRRDLQQVRLVGNNIGASDIYRTLVRPVLKPSKADTLTVTPILVGCALFGGGLKKSSATTDRHGNFKVHISPGLRQVVRLFQLLEAIQSMQEVISTTNNVPILQGGAIADVGDQ